jgi:hypothetical protein
LYIFASFSSLESLAFFCPSLSRSISLRRDSWLSEREEFFSLRERYRRSRLASRVSAKAKGDKENETI